MNVGAWLSQSKKRGQDRREAMASEHLVRIREMGFDHIRLPVDEEQLWDERNHRQEEAWDLLDGTVDQALELGMNVVIDLHILRSHFFNADDRPLFTDPEAPERFAQCWRELSSALRDRPLDRVAYELLNEARADDHDDWNRVYRHAYDALRETEPERVIVLGSNRWNQPLTYEFLEVPEGDENLILTFHYYNPMPITHYRASFIDWAACYEGPIRYPGLSIPQETFNKLDEDLQHMLGGWNHYADRNTVAEDLLWPLAVRARTGLPLYCGEFGVILKAPVEINAAWHRDVIGVFEENEIAWANWNYAGGFGMTESDGTPMPVLKELMAKPWPD